MTFFPTNVLLLIKYLILTRRKQKQCYQLTSSILVLLHVMTWSWREHQGSSCFPSSPSRCSESASTDTVGHNRRRSHHMHSLTSHPTQRKDTGRLWSDFALLFLLTGFVLEFILGVIGRKIELDLFKRFATEFIHERLQGLSFPSNTSTGFVN